MPLTNLDLNALTLTELNEALSVLSSLIQQRQLEERQTVADRRTSILNSIAEITDTLGEDGTEIPNVDTIRGMMAFSDEDIEANLVIAVRLILGVIEKHLIVTRNVAHVVGE